MGDWLYSDLFIGLDWARCKAILELQKSRSFYKLVVKFFFYKQANLDHSLAKKINLGHFDLLK